MKNRLKLAGLGKSLEEYHKDQMQNPEYAAAYVKAEKELRNSKTFQKYKKKNS